MTRAQILEQIAELDKRIHELSASNKVPSLNMKNRSMPWAAIGSAALFLGFYIFGGGILPKIHQDYGLIIGGIGVLMALFAVWRVVMFFLKGGQKTGKQYANHVEMVMKLQKQREELQKALATAK